MNWCDFYFFRLFWESFFDFRNRTHFLKNPRTVQHTKNEIYVLSVNHIALEWEPLRLFILFLITYRYCMAVVSPWFKVVRKKRARGASHTKYEKLSKKKHPSFFLLYKTPDGFLDWSFNLRMDKCVERNVQSLWSFLKSSGWKVAEFKPAWSLCDGLQT